MNETTGWQLPAEAAERIVAQIAHKLTPEESEKLADAIVEAMRAWGDQCERGAMEHG